MTVSGQTGELHTRDCQQRMRHYRIGRFEVERRDLVRTAVAVSTLVPTSTFLRSQRDARKWASAARRQLGMVENITGLDVVDPEERYVVTPLHEGFADVLLLTHLPLDLRFVVRGELFDWTWLGRALKVTDQIMVRPEDYATGYRQLLADAEVTFDRGQSLVAFPQGSILGIEAAFRRGPFRIADRLGKRVLPVIITGTHRVWEHPYTDRLRFGQPVSMKVLDPLPLGGAVASMREVERTMKRIALSPEMAPARRFNPERDGYWDDYAYEIDPEFTEVARLVARHRSTAGGESEVDVPVEGIDPT